MKKTIISEGVRCEGAIISRADLVIWGEVEGKIQTQESLMIEQTGTVQGEIIAKTLFVKGYFKGHANCDSVHILKGAKFIGDIKSAILVIDKEASFEGKNEVKKETTPPLKPQKRPFKDLDTENILL